MDTDGPPLCLFEGCEFYGSLQYDYYCSRHYRLKKSSGQSNVITISPPKQKIESPRQRQLSIKFKVKPIDLIRHFQNELISVINVEYSAFISSPSIKKHLSREEIVSLKYETSSTKLVNLLIDKSQRKLDNDQEMWACLHQGAKDAGNPLLLSLLLFNHLPAKEDFCMFSIFVQHFLKSFIESVIITENLLAQISSIFELSSKGLETIRCSNTGQHLTLLACLPFRYFRWYPNLLCALIKSQQFHYIQLVHRVIYEKAVCGNPDYLQVEEYCRSLCSSSYNNGNKLRDSSPSSTSGMNKLDCHLGSGSPVEDKSDKANKSSEFPKCSINEKKLADYLLCSDDDSEELSPPSSPSSDSSSSIKSANIDLYDYQRELAAPALAGNNVIVISPTNSGKTHVAMAVIQYHLEINPKKCAVFIVPRQNLVEQQHRLIVKYFPNKKVSKVRGGGNAQVCLKPIILGQNIVVLTPECLRNSLDAESEKDRVSLSQISLLVFDECHNCTKNHPYNMIMSRYHDANNPTASKPKILGLTASPGTDRASNLNQAFEHIITLCANLDCKKIAHKSEKEISLQSQQLQATRKAAPFRKIGWLDTQLQQVLTMCEKQLIAMFHSGEIPQTAAQYMNIPSTERGAPPYDNFVGNLKYVDTLIPPKETQVLVHLNCYKKYLDIFNRALIIYRLFRDEDTLEYIRSELDFKSPAEGIHKRLLDHVKDNILKLAQRHMETNPCMETLLQCLWEHLEKEPDSRILVFVKQRNYAFFLKNAFESDARLKDIPVDVIIGAQGDAVPNKGSTTSKWQMEVLEKFHQGKNKVLFSTAVAEEGLDVVRCNLVIRYAHVTNEISMVQSKGRARAANPDYIIIFPSREAWLSRKEATNEVRHDLMVEAVLKFQKMEISESTKKINCKQMQLQEARRESKAEVRPKRYENTEYTFRCMLCNKEVCSSRDIRKRKGTYICINQAIKKRCLIPTSADGTVDTKRPITCGGTCSQKWGVILHFSDMDWISLNIQYFRLIPLNSIKDDTCKIFDKWSEAPFEVQEISVDEIYSNY